MPETFEEIINRILRDHEGYDGNGGTGALPVGDRSTAQRPINKRDLREALKSFADVDGNAADAILARDVAIEVSQNPEDAPVSIGGFSALHHSAKASAAQRGAEIAETGAGAKLAETIIARDTTISASRIDQFVADSTERDALTVASGYRVYMRSDRHLWEYDGATWNDEGLDPTEEKADKASVPKSGSSPVSASGGVMSDRYVTPQGVAAAVANQSALPARNNLLANASVAALLSAVTLMASEVAALKSEVADLRGGGTAADYYIDGTSGDDGNDGLTNATAYASFAPLIALSAGSLDGKVVAVRRGTSVAPMDASVFVADGCTVKSYPSHILSKPYIDCTAAIGAWTLHASGVYKVTLTRDHSGGAKYFGNYFRNAVPMRKVQSVAALSGKGNFVVFAENETTGTVTLYMNAPSDPGADGAAYRWAKYGHAVRLSGAGNNAFGLEGFACGQQDGMFVLANAGDNAGGHTLADCTMWWGGRHSALIGSGALASASLRNKYYGGANEIETGGVLNASGTANSLVFNTPDHSGANCVSQGNVYDGMGRQNYIAGTPRNFTGPYGHDGVDGRAMASFTIAADRYVGMTQIHNTSGAVGTIEDCVFENCATLLAMGQVDGSTYTISRNTGQINVLVSNLSGTDVSIVSRSNKWDILDCGAGSAGFVRSGEGGAGVTNFDTESDTYNVRGVRLAVTSNNRVLFNIKEGHIRAVGATVYPDIALPIKYLIKAAAAVTWDSDNGGNTWPVGATFSDAGTDLSLAGMISAGNDGVTSAMHVMPPARVVDDFDRPDETLASGGYTLLDGADAMSVSSGALAVTSGDTGVYSVAKIAGGVWAAKTTDGVVSGGGPGIALRGLDENNWIMLRETSTAYQIMTRNAGSFSVAFSVTSVTPAAGQAVFAVLMPYTDPNTGTETTRVWLYVDGVALVSNEALTVPAALVGVEDIGFVTRGSAIDPLMSDVSWGAVDQVFAA